MKIMSDKFYENVLPLVLDEIHKSYVEQDKESEFIFYFNMKYVDETIDTITVSVASTMMHQMMLNKNIFEIVQNKIRELTGQSNVTVKCIIKSEAEPVSEKKESTSEEINESNNDKEVSKPKVKHPQLKEEYIFENFIPGDNCKYAYNASIAVADNPGAVKNKNPLLIYGGSGLGKTHLMQAIGNYIYSNNPKSKICYISAESFTNEFLDSIKTKKTQEFKNKYRNLDVLLLDDIHFLQGKEQTQEELFYTFEALADLKSQMVFTCDRPLQEIKTFNIRLISRLKQGLTIDIQAPKYEERYAIITKKLELLEKTLNPEIIDYIAENIETNVRDLEGALNTLVNYEDLAGKLNLEQAKNMLRNFISNTEENISFDVIEKVIAEEHQISVAELKGKKRDKKFVIPRQYAIYIAKTLTEATYMDLAEEFGGKDHTTIMYACNKIADQIKIDSSLKSKIDLYIKMIKEYKK